MPESSLKNINLELEEGIGGVSAKLKGGKPKQVKLLHLLAPSLGLVMNYKLLLWKFLLHIFINSFKFPIDQWKDPTWQCLHIFICAFAKYGHGFYCKGWSKVFSLYAFKLVCWTNFVRLTFCILGAFKLYKKLSFLDLGNWEQVWHGPKFLVRPKMGLSYSNNRIVKNLGHTPNSQH